MGYLKKDELPPVVAIACRALARDKHLLAAHFVPAREIDHRRLKNHTRTVCKGSPINHTGQVESLPHLSDVRAECPDQITALGEVRLFSRDDLQKSALLECDDIEAVTRAAGGITHDVDQAIERMQPGEQIIVLPIGA